ncbi:UvrD-helicase domain-containing protein [Aldersonia sp. NBC_00410]|uniref:UvrD-helicase domain-containing protein n=1 Tax=Aldersonia sp. NBC_00410 TaxID=2975954 RepID=UPI00225B2889|nr:UvrD-helicase domain-containing protein [Aldersonia sp. NBC_00410]MCX5044396.1 UvrD-helicase domain-containing protein [Aldersonia sp. NBC_00410]
MIRATRFDIAGPLPEGTTVLEASAGTGKTYAIVALAARYVAEGIATVPQLLLVTFTRAATQELRERTRERFVRTAIELADPAKARASSDSLVAHLADADDDEVALRRRRLVQALSDFDAATIATTHSFCQQMLDGLGFAGEREPEATLVESIGDLVTQVVDDLYLARYAKSDDRAIDRRDAGVVAAAAVADRQAMLVPEGEREDSAAAHRVAFAAAARAEVQRRKRSANLRDYEDLLSLLHDVLADPEHGPAARDRVRARYRVVLVDEFQDTDPLQWEILRLAFHGHSALVLVGDPKQAIYAFRGAEVLSYLQAVRAADNHLELTQNWRSDGRLVQALDHLYGNAALGHRDIVVHPIESALASSRMAGVPPVRLRYLGRDGYGELTGSGFPKVDNLRPRIIEDVAADIVALLDSAVELSLDEPHPVGPGDIAVLVPTRARAEEMRAALDRVGVASVMASGTSVFATAGAGDWVRVLEALEQPHRADRVRRAALTSLLGWTATDLDRRGDELVAEVGTQLVALADLFVHAGFAALFERLAAQSGLEDRLLSIESGERELTDLRHVAQLLNRIAVERSAGLATLSRWLADRVADPTIESSSDRIRRLDSDAEAVQIATVHTSKGLQYPIVYLPFAWDPAKPFKLATLLFHDDDDRRVLDVGGDRARDHRDRRLRHDEENAGEALRLLYVALTRAMCQVVIWWAPSSGTAASPLHRMIFGRPPGSSGIPGRAQVPADSVVAADLSSWAAGASGLISVEPVPDEVRPARVWSPAEPAPATLVAAAFDRELDFAWRRTSYSALTAAAHETPGVSSEAESPGKTDEPEDEPIVADVGGGVPSPMNELPGGAAFGTLVHEVLELVDPQAPDLPAELVARCREVVAARLAEVDPDALAVALHPVLRTPFDWSGGARGSLADIAASDRLPELDFEIPLAGGDAPLTNAATVHAIAELLRDHLGSDDPMAAYADRLDTLEPVPLRGFLTGSIDAVLRVSGPRFLVVDYKTNRLGLGDLTVEHYTPDRMAEEMLRAHYPLQALIYLVALHRYLRWRMPSYRPAEHLGGARYLFVRGMVGPDTPAGAGVFEWDVPAALVCSLSDLLAGS